MKVAYLEPFSGVSGDMLLGALVDAGVPADELRATIEGLGIDGMTITHERVRRSGLAATKVDVVYPPQHAHRHLKEIVTLLEDSSLPESVKAGAIDVFLALAEAEAEIHGVGIQKVHFHEVGAADAVADVVGAAWGLHRLGVERLYTGPINVGAGMVGCAHGTLPVPAPATLRLLRGWSLFSMGPRRELTTPTGAALVTVLGNQVESLPALRVEADGNGAGGSDPHDWPNFLRLVVGVLARPEPETPGSATSGTAHQHSSGADEHRHGHAHTHGVDAHAAGRQQAGGHEPAHEHTEHEGGRHEHHS